MTEDFVIKYFWSAVGYGLMSIPVFYPVATQAIQGETSAAELHNEVASRTESYVSNRRLLLSLGDAGGRLMYSGKELAQLSGYTGRVYSLLASLHALDENRYPENPRPESLPPNEVSSPTLLTLTLAFLRPVQRLRPRYPRQEPRSPSRRSHRRARGWCRWSGARRRGAHPQPRLAR